MAISLKFYHDSALTQEITSGNPLTATQDTAGALSAVDKTIYLGSIVNANKFQDNTDPGVAAIVVSIADAGTGAPASEFKLALSSGGLATATAGAALTLSTTINGGTANAVPIYTRRDSVLVAAGSYTNITLVTQTLIEAPV